MRRKRREKQIEHLTVVGRFEYNHGYHIPHKIIIIVIIMTITLSSYCVPGIVPNTLCVVTHFRVTKTT